MNDGVNHYDLDIVKGDLQRQIYDMGRRLESMIDDMRHDTRESFVDVRGGIADLHDRINGLETKL